MQPNYGTPEQHENEEGTGTGTGTFTLFVGALYPSIF